MTISDDGAAKGDKQNDTLSLGKALSFTKPIAEPKTPNLKPDTLLTPSLRSQLDGNNRAKSGPRSITTNSVISSRKNGKKKINQYLINH